MGQMFFPGEDQNGNEEYAIAWGRVFFAIVVAALVGYDIFWLVSSCSSSQGEEIAVAEVVSEMPVEEPVEEVEVIEDIEEVIPPFRYKAIKYFRSESVEIDLEADFPTVESVVTDSVIVFFHEFFGDQHRSYLMDGQEILNDYGNTEFREYEKERQNFESIKIVEDAVEDAVSSDEDDDDFEICGVDDNGEAYNEEAFTLSSFGLRRHFKVICVKDKFVTYTILNYIWLGGIQPIVREESGITFNRVSGEQIKYCHFKDLESSSFKKQIKGGIKRYLGIKNDEELAKYLNVEDVNNIPLPSAAPFLTDKGICFKYDFDEISFGCIEYLLPYEDALPYLSEEVLNLTEGIVYNVAD